jgi:hypothetical protein
MTIDFQDSSRQPNRHFMVSLHSRKLFIPPMLSPHFSHRHPLIQPLPGDNTNLLEHIFNLFQDAVSPQDFRSTIRYRTPSL